MQVLARSDNLKLKAWMSAPRHTVEPDTPLDDARRLMRASRVRHLLVSKKGELVGVVTDRDLRAQRRVELREVGAAPRKATVRAVMSTSLFTAKADDPTAGAARLMIDNGIGCLPITDDAGELVGIVTSTDLLKALTFAVDPEGSWRHEQRRARHLGR
jgi:acetoin utilization protein AcuB